MSSLKDEMHEYSQRVHEARRLIACHVRYKKRVARKRDSAEELEAHVKDANIVELSSEEEEDDTQSGLSEDEARQLSLSEFALQSRKLSKEKIRG